MPSLTISYGQSVAAPHSPPEQSNPHATRQTSPPKMPTYHSSHPLKSKKMTGPTKQSHFFAMLDCFAMTIRSLHRPLDACLAHADVAGGVYNRRPGIVRQGHAIFG